MSVTRDRGGPAEPEVREIADRYVLGDDVEVVMIQDPQNCHAWIQSDVAVAVEQ